MTDVQAGIERNAASLARLRELVGRLSPSDLERSLGEGWTVHVALVHMAFWDLHQAVVVRGYLEGTPLGEAVSEPDYYYSDDVVNEAIVPVARGVAPAAVPALVIEAAEAIDEALKTADRDALARLAGGPYGAIVRRWVHREEHLEQIERAL